MRHLSWELDIVALPRSLGVAAALARESYHSLICYRNNFVEVSDDRLGFGGKQSMSLRMRYAGVPVLLVCLSPRLSSKVPHLPTVALLQVAEPENAGWSHRVRFAAFLAEHCKSCSYCMRHNSAAVFGLV